MTRFRSNKTLYSQVSLRPLPVDYQPRVVDLPTTTSDDNQSQIINSYFLSPNSI